MNKRKEALLKLEEALRQSPQLVKKIIQLDSTILQNNRIVALISRYKKRTY